MPSRLLECSRLQRPDVPAARWTQARNKIRNRNQRHETGQSKGNQPAGRNRNQRTPVTEPRRHVTETGAITQGFFCIEDIAIVITSSSKHGFCRQTQCLQAIRCQSRLRVAVFSQVLGASTCSPAHRRDRPPELCRTRACFYSDACPQR